MSVPHPMLLPNFDLSMVTHLTPEKEKNIADDKEEEVKIDQSEHHDNQMEILSEDSEEL